MLKKNHGKHYLILNLSDRDYDYSLFENRVIVCGFPDHHSPPIALMWAIYSFVDLWMAVSPQNVFAAHCLAGTRFFRGVRDRKGKDGHRDFERTRTVHLLTDDARHFCEGALPERQIGVESAGEFLDEARPDEELMRVNFGITGVLPERLNERFSPFHRPILYHIGGTAA